MRELDVIRINELPETQNSEEIWMLGEDASGNSVRVKIKGFKVATTTADGLMSATDKEKLDELSSMETGVKPLSVAALTGSGVVDGGKAYRTATNSSYIISGVGIFTDDADMCTITTQGNTSVVFHSLFKLQKDLSTINGSISQFKQYTIQRVPMPGDGARGDIYLVNCSLYG